MAASLIDPAFWMCCSVEDHMDGDRRMGDGATSEYFCDTSGDGSARDAGALEDWRSLRSCLDPTPPSSAIKDAAGHARHVVGRCKPARRRSTGESPHRSPLSGAPCLFWELIVEEVEDGGAPWRAAESGGDADFYLVDGAARIRVPCRALRPLGDARRCVFGGATGKALPPAVAALLRRRACDVTAPRFGYFGEIVGTRKRAFGVSERFYAENSVLSVLGVVERGPKGHRLAPAVEAPTEDDRWNRLLSDGRLPASDDAPLAGARGGPGGPGGPLVVSLTCPRDASPGTRCHFQLADRRIIHVAIPDGIGPGDAFQATV